MKPVRILLLLLTAAVFLVSAGFVSASDQVTLELYWGEGCPHCAKAKPFLEQLAESDERIDLVMFEVYRNPDNYGRMLERVNESGITDFGVPLVFIGDEYVIGYNSDETTGAYIRSIALGQLDSEPGSYPDDEETVNVPLLNEVDPRSVSLPLLAVVLGIVDGFNPCALWALLFLISLLIGTEDRKKLILLGSLFILTSGVVYFLFMTAWFNLFVILGFIPLIRYLVGAAALGAAYYNLREWWNKRKGGCEKGDKAKRSRVFERAKRAVHSSNLLLAAAGIILLALSVNLIELMCSAGLPAIFTHVLSLNQLQVWEYYGLMMIYILFFMIDDLVIFLMAVFTFRIVGIDSKYGRLSRLIGGVLMALIGLLLIFRPEWLQFG
ncbi:MAG: hypothetical protein TR69_WS6001001343 [candidate division WS6 bacterium OLB20]|uniref:Uncharacterized protein n=1 Tax=candidate division WS6 bacterium OLB20 TaxID=1617426 RepID=A0A136LWM7_9BACT|nr:MAG: hypothetical protein TR69_WS6001001343 [candidate division WS6 bacterium OLB20]